MNPPIHKRCRYAVCFGNLNPRLSDGVLPDKSPVNTLRLRRGPRAIGGGVVSVNIDAFNREAHVVSRHKRPSLECIEAIPFRANRNATPAVMLKTNSVGIVAPCFHRLPNSVQSCPGLAVSGKGAPRRVSLAASARRRFIGAQVAPTWRSDIPAVAPTKPYCGPFGGVPVFLNNGPSTEPLPGQVN